jgi:ribosomal protein S18 acetylase RimI-like enzyme
LSTVEQTADPSAIAALHRAELAEAGRTKLPEVEAIVAEWQNHTATRFLLLRESEPLAFLAYQPLGSCRLYIADLFVAPEFRHQGRARLLLREAKRLATVLELDVGRANLPALALYRSEGFVAAGEVGDKIRLRWTGSRAGQETE